MGLSEPTLSFTIRRSTILPGQMMSIVLICYFVMLSEIAESIWLIAERQFKLFSFKHKILLRPPTAS